MPKKAKPKPAVQPAANKPFFQPFAKLAAKKGKTSAGAGKEARPAGAATAATTKPSPPLTPRPAPRSKPTAPQDLVSDADTFAIYMGGVKTLDGTATRIPKTASSVEPPRRAAPTEDPDAHARASMRSLVTEGIRFDVSDDGRTMDGRRIDVDPREVRRLRRGEYPVDGSIDLHGMNAGEAREAVEVFVKKRHAEGDRVVAIIHGKGSHSPRGQAVLRGEIAAWLSQGKVARDVAAFASAPSEEGGQGALLVLLAR
jgi:DNA-nicking Smr family endonuclease